MQVVRPQAPSGIMFADRLQQERKLLYLVVILSVAIPSLRISQIALRLQTLFMC
jgi:hypothetical protein